MLTMLLCRVKSPPKPQNPSNLRSLSLIIIRNKGFHIDFLSQHGVEVDPWLRNESPFGRKLAVLAVHLALLVEAHGHVASVGIYNSTVAVFLALHVLSFFDGVQLHDSLT